MGRWYLSWEIDKGQCMPGKQCKIKNVQLENTSENLLYVRKVGVHFDWLDETYWYPTEELNIVLMSGDKRLLPPIEFGIPANVVGEHEYIFGVEMQEYLPQQRIWKDNEFTWTEEGEKILINIYPRYRAFVSRGVRDEEKGTIAPLEQTIKDWGFETYTYEGPNSPEAIYIMNEEVEKADCIIHIATKRFMDITSGWWQTSPWIHREWGMGFGKYKPILIIKEEDVYFDGLLSPTIPTIQFDITERGVQILNDYMPQFREQIRKRKNKQFWGKVAEVAPPLIGGVILGGLIFGSKAKN